MSDKPDTRTEARDFMGVFSFPDSLDLSPGTAREQVNVRSNRAGKLVTRDGYREVTFEDG
jgi:hypothetical protein